MSEKKLIEILSLMHKSLDESTTTPLTGPYQDTSEMAAEIYELIERIDEEGVTV